MEPVFLIICDGTGIHFQLEFINNIINEIREKNRVRHICFMTVLAPHSQITSTASLTHTLITNCSSSRGNVKSGYPGGTERQGVWLIPEYAICRNDSLCVLGLGIHSPTKSNNWISKLVHFSVKLCSQIVFVANTSNLQSFLNLMAVNEPLRQNTSLEDGRKIIHVIKPDQDEEARMYTANTIREMDVARDQLPELFVQLSDHAVTIIDLQVDETSGIREVILKVESPSYYSIIHKFEIATISMKLQAILETVNN